MRKKSTRLVMFSALMLCATLAPAARAGLTQAFTETVGPMSLDFPVPQLVSIPQFDPAQGTLLFVTVRITASYDAQIQVENKGDGPANVSVLATETVVVTPPLFVFPVEIANKELLPPTTVMIQPTETHLFTYLPDNPRDVEMADLLFDELDPNLDMFIGNGDLPDFEVDGFGMSVLTSSGSSDLNIVSDLKASVEIEVIYNFIPEPATGALMALGLGCVGRRARRRR